MEQVGAAERLEVFDSVVAVELILYDIVYHTWDRSPERPYKD